ncbi:oxoglutarate/iron-dependent dioxygenase [Artemisia annua]|uniref:Oxoglutarate/iron-dependent dioxygenase n=1 Tax=Artemisia annua TaxID=35608 RepID=A0A2U1MKD9_ARTAN|nr:oxoglutarate/iron-dependent dioxygenase [Artemisia annua]
MASLTTEHKYDRLKEVKQFDESQIGVKGLLDTGITTIPPFFHQPPENLPSPQPKNQPRLTVPVIDLSQDRSTVVDEIRGASSILGFFQIVNHSISVTSIESVLKDMKNFYEQTTEYKMKFYNREVEKGVTYSTNMDLYKSKAASWRDTIQVWLSPMEPAWKMVPEMCRKALADWDKAITGLVEELMSILCEGLGIKRDKLKEWSCLEGRLSISHYYPQCPQPELTVGLTAHTDPTVLTVLVQNEIGGLLQVKCGEQWVEVEPVPGAIVVNIGDLLQMMSNDIYRSVEHRVLANNVEGARVSVAHLFNPSNREKLFGPFPELISAEKPAVYHEFLHEDFMRRVLANNIETARVSISAFFSIQATKRGDIYGPFLELKECCKESPVTSHDRCPAFGHLVASSVSLFSTTNILCSLQNLENCICNIYKESTLVKNSDKYFRWRFNLLQKNVSM